MPTKRIRNFILQHPTFQRMVDDVIKAGVEHELPSVRPATRPAVIDWSYMLLCASALARSEEGDDQRIALRIADTCMKLPQAEEGHKKAAALILDAMANQRAQGLAVELSLIPPNWDVRIPLPLRADQVRRSVEDAITTSDLVNYPVNRFQNEFWTALQDSYRVSASAPTSAGKSFILRLWVAETFRRKPAANIMVLVPTRALIQEFADEFASDIEKGLLSNVAVHTLPLDEFISPEKGHLCVFTQERLHILLSRSKTASFDLIIVDEAQKVGDGYRGVLLEQVLNECEKRNALSQIVYASPFAENPSYLVRGAPALAKARPVDREVTTVTQNLLFASQERGNSKEWAISFENDERSLRIGTFTLPFRPYPISKRVTLVALALGQTTAGNLVYANGASEAEKYAQQLYDGIGELEPGFEVKDKRLQELIKLVQKTVHRQYNLAHTLTRGVAYHYGNMPLLIRTEIEGLFREKVLRFLVCTGTLIEGVNLPCKAIYMRGPQKGRGNPMLPADFWNLAGRAGRWGKEFHGTIVCIDPNDSKVWETPPPKKRVKQKIVSAAGENLLRLNELISYIDEGYPDNVSKDEPVFDYTLSFLLHLLVRDGSVDQSVLEYGDEDTKAKFVAKLENELNNFPLPRELVFRHPGILPVTMANLAKRLSGLTDDELVALSPVQPEADGAEIVYQRILRFINDELRPRWAMPGSAGDNRLKQLACLMVDWMQGRPLAVLIRTREKIEKWKAERGSKPKKLSAVIIQVMGDVEEYARFKIPKFVKTFLDILYLHAASRGLESKLVKLPDLELWMEFGVSTKTQLGLMELGLSRTSAIELMEYVMNSDLGKEASLSWLQSANIEGLALPGAVLDEVRRVLDRHQRAADRTSFSDTSNK